MVAGDYRLDYAKLDRATDRLAGHFHRLGIVRGDRVAILCGNGREFIYALLTSIRLGAVAVPIDVRARRAELTFILEHSGAKALVFDADLAANLPDADAKSAPALRMSVGSAPGATPLDELLETRSPPAPRADPGEDEMAVILYTATGSARPKGAMLTHLNLVHAALHHQACMPIRAGDRSLLAVPASQATGLVAGILAVFSVGGCVIALRDLRAGKFLELAARERMTHSVAAPGIYEACMREPDFDRFNLGAWRSGGVSGAPMPQELIRMLTAKVPRVALMNVYGAAEATSQTIIGPIDGQAANPGSVGTVAPCVDLRVMDDAGREVVQGERGEVWIAGPTVIPGYWDDPGATARSFVGGYWRSGDIGALDAWGRVHIFGRSGDPDLQERQ